MAKNMEITLLCDFYGDMLTEKQRDMIDLYYGNDLSLAEIAENEGITRQGVRDSINRAENQLPEMEERLGLVRRFREMQRRRPQQVAFTCGFMPTLSRQIYAGADFFLMPSQSEPCGLAQMVSCRYGTIPVVRETGGLRDSIHDSGDGYGNGFTFANYNAHELYEACWRAKEGYWNKEGWPVLVKRAMECDFSWSNSAKSYEGLYNEVVNLW